MKTWLTKSPAGAHMNIVWVELPDGCLLTLTEDGRIEKENHYNSCIVKRLLTENEDGWEVIS